MAQIKQTVELLTKILKSNGLTRIRPECFRQAKFDKDEAAEPLWKLLFQVIYYLKYGQVDDITIKSYAQLSTEELCVYVKTEMKMRGFVSRTFHELPNDMSSGSRELLLSFGWLMCRSQLMQTFTENCCAFLDTANSNPDTTKLENLVASEFKPNRQTLLQDKLSYLMWLNGKLRLSFRNLHTLQQEKSNLTDKIERSTHGVAGVPQSRSHLSVLEVMMLKSPDLLKKNLRLLESDSTRIESLIAWQKQHDQVFWKWMESVLDAKLSNSEGEIQEVSDHVTPRSLSAKRRIDSKLELSQSLEKYNQLVEQMESDLLSQRCVRGEDIDRLLKDILSDIERHRSNLSLVVENPSTHATSKKPDKHLSLSDHLVYDQSDKSLLRPHRHIPLKHAIDTVSQTSDGSDGASAGSGEVSITSAAVQGELSKMESEIDSLQDLIERLQTDIEYKQTRYKDDLTSLSSEMTSLYDCITSGPTVFHS